MGHIRRGTGAAVLFAFLAGVASAADRPPNVVLVLADDLGYECVGANGGESYETPRLDDLARSGARFERCYATPYCTPSRVQLLTGRYGFRTGQVPARLPGGERTFAHVLADAGYATAVAGKWKLCDFVEDPDHARDAGFREYCLWSGREFHPDGVPSSRYWSPTVWQDGRFRDDTGDRYGPDLFVEFLVDFMRRHRDEPFLAYYPMTLVHGPPDPPPGPDGQPPSVPLAPNETFRRMVAYMDEVVGRLVAAVDELGLAESTLFLFTADNGTAGRYRSHWNGETIRGGKGEMLPAGFRVPLIARWTGTIAPGVVLGEIVDFSDFLPTLAGVAGAPLPSDRPLDGRSFLPLLRDEPYDPREWVYVQCFEERLVFDGRFLLRGDGRLVDAANDPAGSSPFLPGAQGEPAGVRRRLDAVLAGLR